MAEFGLFVGWGDVRTGRSAAATKVFAEAMAHWSALQATGEIESFETVILGYHGGDLGGYFMLRGDPERLGWLSMSPEFLRLMNRASAVVERLGVVPANLDAGAARLVGEAYQQIEDLL